jgi:hypothetical protein
LGRHASARGKSFVRTSISGAAIASLSLTSLAILPSVSFGSTACDSVKESVPSAERSGVTAGVVTIGGAEVCQIAFLDDVSEITIPDWVEKLSVVAVGGGGGGDYALNYEGYAGGGGQLVFDDSVDLSTRSFSVAVGSGGARLADGEDTSLNQLTATPSTLLLAKGGTHGDFGPGEGGSSYEYSEGSSTSNLLPGIAGDPGEAGGAGTSSSNSGATAGAGMTVEVLLEDPDDVGYLDPRLWSEGIEVGALGTIFSFEFGQGGTANDSTTAALAGSGQGANASASGVGESGSGIVIMSFSLDAAPDEPEAEPEESSEPETEEETSITPSPYAGPIPVVLFPGIVDPGASKNVVLRGERLSTISKAEVDGKEVVVTKATDGEVSLVIPPLDPGTYTIKYMSATGTIYHQDSLVVRTNASVSIDSANSFFVSKRFTNYRGDRGAIVPADQRAITAFVSAHPGLKEVTCVGSTSGVPALETDEALALARAKNACLIVEELVPGVKTRIVSNTGKGVGQFFRAVSLFGKG